MFPAVMKHAAAHLSVLVAFCLLASAAPAGAGNYSIPPADAERRFAQEPFEILEAKRTASGVAGAQRWKIRFADGLVVKVKWKAAPRYTTDTWNNSPRREIAAYEVQKLFLDPEDYIVPPSEVRCIPLAQYRKIDSNAKPTLARTQCVFGVLSLWLQDVEEPSKIWHPDLFDQGGYYRFSIASVDVLTFLIGHQDGRPANFLWSTDARRHVFSIDNGVSLHAFPFNPLVRNWNSIRVPALPRKVMERLDRTSVERIASLGILRHLEPDANGVLRPAKPAGNIGPGEGTRVQGTTLQLGLRDSEVVEVRERINDLLKRTASGRLPLF